MRGLVPPTAYIQKCGAGHPRAGCETNHIYLILTSPSPIPKSQVREASNKKNSKSKSNLELPIYLNRIDQQSKLQISGLVPFDYEFGLGFNLVTDTTQHTLAGSWSGFLEST